MNTLHVRWSVLQHMAFHLLQRCHRVIQRWRVVIANRGQGRTMNMNTFYYFNYLQYLEQYDFFNIFFTMTIYGWFWIQNEIFLDLFTLFTLYTLPVTSSVHGLGHDDEF